jgi:hypothetical protein
VLASSDQEHVEHDANQNHDEPAKGKKRANFQQAVEGLASLHQSKFDPERQKQTYIEWERAKLPRKKRKRID